MLGLLILALLVAFIPYDENEDAYILILLVAGLLQMGKWMNDMPYHRIWNNYLEIIEGVLLFLGGFLFAIEYYVAPKLHVPICLLFIFPVFSLSLYFLFKMWYKHKEKSKVHTEDDFELHMRRRVQQREEMMKNGLDTIDFDDQTLEIFRTFEENNPFHEYLLIYHFHYFKHTAISINHILYFINQMYQKYKSVELTVERRRCLTKAKALNNMSNDAKDVYYASQQVVKITEVLRKDAEVCHELPLIIEYFFKNVALNAFSTKMVPMLQKIEEVAKNYDVILKKNYTKEITAYYSSYTEDILGDPDLSHDIMMQSSKFATTGRDIDFLGDKALILYVYASGPNQRLIQSAKGIEALGYTSADLQGAEFTELIPSNFSYWKHSSDMLARVLNCPETNPMFEGSGLVQFVDKYGYLVPFDTKMRIMIDKNADLFIAVVCRIMPKFQPFAFLDGDDITGMTKSFQSFITQNLDMPYKSSYNLLDINANYNGKDEIVLKSDKWQIIKGKIPQELFRHETTGLYIEKISNWKRLANKTASIRSLIAKEAKRVEFEYDPHDSQENKQSEEKDDHEAARDHSSFGTSNKTGNSRFISSSSKTSLRAQRMNERITSVFRMFSIVKIGVFVCVILLLSVGGMAVIFIKNINDRMDDSITQMRDMSLRRYLCYSASLYAKEHMLIQSGYGFLGDIEYTKSKLHDLGVKFQEQYENQMDKDTDFKKYQELLDNNNLIWHDYMQGRFHGRLISLKDMLNELSTRCFGGEEGDPDDLMTLYRDGAADAIYAFNHTINVYIDEFGETLSENQSLVITILIVTFCMVTLFWIIIAIPVFLRLNRSRKVLWTELAQYIIQNGRIIKTVCWERLTHTHGIENEEIMRSHKVKDLTNKYGTHLAQIRMYILLSLMFLASAGFIFSVWTIGQTKASAVLKEKRDVVNWSGYRRALGQGLLFWQRELYLNIKNETLKYDNMITDHRFHFFEQDSWDKIRNELKEKQSQLFGITQLMRSDHKELLFDDACLVPDCQQSLHIGLHMGLLELINLSSNVIREFSSKKNYEESGGLDMEKLVRDLTDPLADSMDFYDDDGQNVISDLYDTTVNITIAYSILNVAFYFLVLYGQLKRLQTNLICEVKLVKLFQKDEEEAKSDPTSAATTQSAAMKLLGNKPEKEVN